MTTRARDVLAGIACGTGILAAGIILRALQMAACS